MLHTNTHTHKAFFTHSLSQTHSERVPWSQPVRMFTTRTAENRNNCSAEPGGTRAERQERLTQQRVASPRQQLASALLPADMLVLLRSHRRSSGVVAWGGGEKKDNRRGNFVIWEWPLAENTSRQEIPSHAGCLVKNSCVSPLTCRWSCPATFQINISGTHSSNATSGLRVKITKRLKKWQVLFE